MFMIPIWLDQAIVAAVYGFALLKGGAPERILAGICGVVWFWNTFVHRLWLGHGSPYLMTTHVLLFVVTVALAFHYDRWWLLVAGMAGVLSVATDAAALMMPLHWWAFGTALFIWSYIFIAALAAGAWTSWRERVNDGGASLIRSDTPPGPPAGLGATSGPSGRSSAA